MLILRQHWLNKRDGYGDARQNKKKQLPDYMMTQSDWISELTQDQDYRGSLAVKGLSPRELAKNNNETGPLSQSARAGSANEIQAPYFGDIV